MRCKYFLIFVSVLGYHHYVMHKMAICYKCSDFGFFLPTQALKQRLSKGSLELAEELLLKLYRKVKMLVPVLSTNYITVYVMQFLFENFENI